MTSRALWPWSSLVRCRWNSLQGNFTAGITGLGADFGVIAQGIIASQQDTGNLEQAMTSNMIGGQ